MAGLRARRVATLLGGVLVALVTVPSVPAVAASDSPYLAPQVPVAKGCIVLDRTWAGNKVFLVQRRLGVVGSRDRFDDATGAAVRQFQRGHGLRATGRVNARTWRALDTGRRFCMDRFTVQPVVADAASRDQRVEAMIGWARGELGARYIWGGAGPIGYDCSGLALQAMHAGGLVLPTVTTYLHQRQDFGTATAIYESGLTRVPFAQRKRGDLVFWGYRGSMAHMALYLGDGRILEAVRPRVQRASVWSHSIPIKPFVVRPFTVGQQPA
ncbi:MAG: NlpC/P60 family protein [Actinomycetota bacterium]|nr:NlpC/P60 family protein [Actinomycetota bacterium]MDH5277605.1 NlpC/P60 family protein [Actinomycetota bacterium]